MRENISPLKYENIFEKKFIFLVLYSLTSNINKHYDLIITIRLRIDNLQQTTFDSERNLCTFLNFIFNAIIETPCIHYYKNVIEHLLE